MMPRGSTLLEVALAVALFAATGMGLIATQLSLSRHGQSVAMRAQAAFVADAFAEMVADAGDGAEAAGQWKARAAALIAGGSVSVDAVSAYTSSATVSWAARSYGPLSTPADAAASASCPATSGVTRRDCVSVVFAR